MYDLVKVIAIAVPLDFNGGIEVLEEGKRRLVDDDAVASFPGSDCIVKELGSSKGDEIPKRRLEIVRKL